MSDKELELREKAVLEALVRSYVEETMPVSSSFLVEKYGFEWSSATVRNTMAFLEKEGFLIQPHTSAGRIPTDKGYRYYVDHVVKQKKLTPKEEFSIRRRYDSVKIEDFDEIIEKTAKIICAITSQAALATKPKISSSAFKKISLFLLNREKLLAVILNSSGMVKTVIVNLPRDITVDEIERAENFLNNELAGHSLDTIKTYLLNEIKRRRDAVDSIIDNAFEIFDLIDLTDISNKLFIDGLSIIMEKPEFKDFDKSRGLLHLLEQKTEIYEIMSNDLENFSEDIKVHIGRENVYEDIQDCTFITSGYYVEEQVMGSLGVLGPTRMAYEKIIPVVNCISHILSGILTEHVVLRDKKNDRKSR